MATLSEAPRGAEHADEDEVPSKAAYCRECGWQLREDELHMDICFTCYCNRED